jgi:GBP family porin
VKKYVIGAAALAAFSTVAHAQSSVTLYGFIDTGIAYVNNEAGHSNWALASSTTTNQFWGLKGTEDLGGSLHAVFNLQEGFNTNNGKTAYANTMFGRQAYVGLQDDKYGTVTLGRQYDSAVDYLGPIALSNYGDGNNLAAHPYDNDNLDDSFYINNSVKYTSATYNGLQFGGLYGFSNQAGGFADNRVYSFGVSYSNGPVNLAAAYMEINNGAGGPLQTAPAATGGALSSNDMPNFPAQRQRVMGAGGNYTFGKAQIGLIWTHTMFNNATGPMVAATPASFSTLVFDNYEVNAHYALTSAFSLSGAYTFTDGRYGSAGGSADPKWHQVTVMADYFFSKRTDVYAQGAYMHAYGASASSPLALAYINGMSPSSTSNQVVATVGIRHRF